MRTVKYSSAIPAEISSACAEQLEGCEGGATVHVCFEDGSGVSVCLNCLEARINEGSWVTDACQVLLAS